MQVLLQLVGDPIAMTLDASFTTMVVSDPITMMLDMSSTMIAISNATTMTLDASSHKHLNTCVNKPLLVVLLF
jgi:hypothetical protein